MKKTLIWAHGLGSAVITGACSAGLSSLGLTAANLIGIKIPQLDLKQLGSIALGGGIVGMMAYLSKSPLPNGEENQPKENDPKT